MHRTTKTPGPVELLLDSNRGVYIPRDFRRECARPDNISDAYWDGISDPDSADYWECWDNILCNAEYRIGGDTWILYHDGDVWALCPERMSREELTNFFGFDPDKYDNYDHYWANVTSYRA